MSDRVRVRVLVVDGDPRTTEAARLALPPPGYEIVWAGDAARALDALRGGGVDALVSELVLPDADGLHLLVEARLRHPLLPRIVVTALEDFAAAVTAINEAEVFRFLRKPAEAASLRAAVEEALGRAASLHEARGVQERAERRRLALIDLESEFPGISMVSHGPEGYFIPPGRLRGLATRLHGSPLGRVLAGSFEESPETS